MSGLQIRFEFRITFFLVRGCIGVFRGNGGVGGILSWGGSAFDLRALVGGGEGDLELEAEEGGGDSITVLPAIIRQ